MRSLPNGCRSLAKYETKPRKVWIPDASKQLEGLGLGLQVVVAGLMVRQIGRGQQDRGDVGRSLHVLGPHTLTNQSNQDGTELSGQRTCKIKNAKK